MAKVVYEGKECEVISVETEWKWGCYKDDSVRMPCDTWFLLNADGCLVWVNKCDCEGIK